MSEHKRRREMQRMHARRHREERRLEAEGVDYIEQSRRSGAGQLLEALPESHPIKQRKRAALEGIRRRQREQAQEEEQKGSDES